MTNVQQMLGQIRKTCCRHPSLPYVDLGPTERRAGRPWSKCQCTVMLDFGTTQCQSLHDDIQVVEESSTSKNSHIYFLLPCAFHDRRFLASVLQRVLPPGTCCKRIKVCLSKSHNANSKHQNMPSSSKFACNLHPEASNAVCKKIRASGL